MVILIIDFNCNLNLIFFQSIYFRVPFTQVIIQPQAHVLFEVVPVIVLCTD